jgi:peptidoglycan hydrolase CwlO-like protein
MANVFAILTAIVMAVSAFFAFKNWKAYYNDDPLVLGTEQQGIVQKRHEEEARRNKQSKIFGDLKKELANTHDDRVATEKTAEERLATLKDQEKKNKDLQAKIADYDRKISDNKAKIAEMEDKLKETGDIKDLVSELRRLKTEIARLEEGIDADNARLATLTTNIKGTQAIIDDLKSEESNHVNKISYCRNTRIRSVFGNWGFVTLSGGNNDGVVQDSLLDVVRDGETIAKLYVTAVEANSAAASVDPDSIKPGTVLMVGDKVVPAKKEEGKGAAKPAKGVPSLPQGAEPAEPTEQPAADAEKLPEPPSEPEPPAPADAGAGDAVDPF